MNKDDVFERFIKNEKLREYVNIKEEQINQIHLYTEISNRLIDVIKTTIIYLDEDTSIDLVARKINQSFKNEIISGDSLFVIDDHNQ